MLDAAEAGAWETRSTRATLIENASAIEVVYPAGPTWPMVEFPVAEGDWSAFDALVVDLDNPSDQPFEISLRVDGEGWPWRAASYELEPRQRRRLHFYLGERLMPGAKWLPPTEFLLGREGDGIAWMDSRQQSWLPLNAIEGFQFFIHRTDRDRTLVIHGAELVSMALPEPRAFVDRFGQFTGDTWAWKIHDASDLAADRAAEEAFLASHPGVDGRNAWGGWAGGPQLEATGRFRVAKHEGRWWLVDPDGRLFWSSGVTGVRPQSPGPIDDRAWAFTWLPDPDGPMGAYRGGLGGHELRHRTSVDFARINLHRKWGPSHAELGGDDFAALAHRRLASWGFNTVGNWSDPAVWRQRQTPYTIPIHPRVPRIPGVTGRTFPDVFGEAYWREVDAKLAEVAEFKNDPWLLGVFIENELPCDRYSYQGPPVHAASADLLGAEATWATKRRIVALLRERHGTIERLNETWGASFASWDDVLKPVELTAEQRSSAMPDLRAITSLVWTRFSRGCREAIDRHLPGALYLGMRFSTYNREAIAAQARFCDVVTFNVYSFAPTEVPSFDIVRDVDVPVLIGEYHFHSTEGGYFGRRAGGVESNNEKVAEFRSYLREVLASPQVVGAHWFTFRDQPITGRWDGENYAIGLYTIPDTPYRGFRKAARSVHETMYETRHASGAATGGDR